MIESQDPFTALCHLIVVCASSPVPLSCVSTSLMAFKAETWLHQSSRIFTDMSDMSHAAATGTLGRGYKSASTKCVNSLPPKQSSLFILSAFLDIRGFEDLWQMVEKFDFAMLLPCVMCNSIRNPLRDGMLKTKDSKCELDEEHCVKGVFPRHRHGN